MDNDMLAKAIVKNKFWIVEDTEGEKIGTIQKVQNGSRDVVLVKGRQRTKFPSIKILGEKHNIKFSTPRKSRAKKSPDVYGYPAEGEVHNGVFDLEQNLPIYTKIEKSKSFFCAGHFLIKFNNTWVKNFCPKLLTLDRNEWAGPYRTDAEMVQALKDIKGL